MSTAAGEVQTAGVRRVGSDAPFLASLGLLGGTYIVLLLAMLGADAAYTSPDDLVEALGSPEIHYSIKLSLVSCTVTMLLSLCVAVPIGYLMARFEFPGKKLLDALLDIPIVLPPLVIGLSLLILFQTTVGREVQDLLAKSVSLVLALPGVYPLLDSLKWLAPFLGGAGVIVGAGFGLERSVKIYFTSSRRTLLVRMRKMIAPLLLGPLLGWGAGQLAGNAIELLVPGPGFKFSIYYSIPGVILAQFMVACAFAVRTMMATFEQISPRTEQVALTLGCTRGQAFWRVVLPEARRGVLTAATLAWARSLGEFGPILVFAGSTRFKTEVLPTTVFLELTVGNIEAAVAVSLLMVVMAVAVLVIVRVYGVRPLVAGGNEP